MPQFDPSVAVPQIAWLIAVFAVLYLIVRAALPKVERVVGGRAGLIGDDLNHAEMAKATAGTVIAGYEASLAAARGDAARLAEDARAAASADTAARLNVVADELDASTGAAMARIDAARAEAVANLRTVAEDATADIVARLTGRRPDPAAVAAAVAG